MTETWGILYVVTFLSPYYKENKKLKNGIEYLFLVLETFRVPWIFCDQLLCVMQLLKAKIIYII